jgi:hypothetical protein
MDDAQAKDGIVNFYGPSYTSAIDVTFNEGVTKDMVAQGKEVLMQGIVEGLGIDSYEFVSEEYMTFGSNEFYTLAFNIYGSDSVNMLYYFVVDSGTEDSFYLLYLISTNTPTTEMEQAVEMIMSFKPGVGAGS